MLTLKNVKTLDGKVEDIQIDSYVEETLDAGGHLLLLPALIDTHVDFRLSGSSDCEDWVSGAHAALAGGVTTVFDVPLDTDTMVDEGSFHNKLQLIEKQLVECSIPLRYHLWLAADKNHLDAIGRLYDKVVGVKIYLEPSLGPQLANADSDLERIFQIAAQHDMIVAVHAEDEKILNQNLKLFGNQTDPAYHSKIRSREAVIKGTTRAVELAERYKTQLYLCHLSTKEEIELIRYAKKREMLVYAEVCPHHLHFSEEDYATQKTLIQVNPPVRLKSDIDALWEGINDGTVDVIASDHKGISLENKQLPYGKAQSGVPGIETMLPFLLNAHHQGKISLEKIIELTRINPKEIFRLKQNRDFVLVDLDLEKKVTNASLKTTSKWSPFTDITFRGWPKYTILKGRIYEV